MDGFWNNIQIPAEHHYFVGALGTTVMGNKSAKALALIALLRLYSPSALGARLIYFLKVLLWKLVVRFSSLLSGYNVCP